MSWRAYKSSRDPRWKDKTGVAIAKRGHGEVAVSSAGITRAVGVSHKLERLVPGVGWRWGEDGWLYLRRPAWLPPLECDAGKGE